MTLNILLPLMMSSQNVIKLSAMSSTALCLNGCALLSYNYNTIQYFTDTPLVGLFSDNATNNVNIAN